MVMVEDSSKVSVSWYGEMNARVTVGVMGEMTGGWRLGREGKLSTLHRPFGDK